MVKFELNRKMTKINQPSFWNDFQTFGLVDVGGLLQRLRLIYH